VERKGGGLVVAKLTESVGVYSTYRKVTDGKRKEGRKFY
jgi:hypothetical protein